jgi:hypothetical protein
MNVEDLARFDDEIAAYAARLPSSTHHDSEISP